MTTVLVVDDEPQITRTLRINLTARGYDVLTAPDGATALRAASERKPDVVVLDLGLPDLHGTTVIERLRRWTSTPIIVLSARTESTDKILALDAGRCVPQKLLLKEVWGPTHQDHSHYLRVYFAQLRRKLEPQPSRPRYLITEPGLGYRLDNTRTGQSTTDEPARRNSVATTSSTNHDVGMANGTVKFFNPEKGWGAIASPDLPDGADAWVHYSAIETDGFRALEAGDRVEFTFEQVQQDSFRFRATRVHKL